MSTQHESICSGACDQPTEHHCLDCGCYLAGKQSADADLLAALKETVKRITHTRDCEIRSRDQMSALAAKTMEDVLGSSKCNCGLKNLKDQAQKAVKKALPSWNGVQPRPCLK